MRLIGVICVNQHHLIKINKLVRVYVCPAKFFTLAGLLPFPEFSLKQYGLVVLKMLPLRITTILLFRRANIYKPSMVLELESIRLWFWIRLFSDPLPLGFLLLDNLWWVI